VAVAAVATAAGKRKYMHVRMRLAADLSTPVEDRGASKAGPVHSPIVDNGQYFNFNITDAQMDSIESASLVKSSSILMSIPVPIN
jgi:hypothetical protein